MANSLHWAAFHRIGNTLSTVLTLGEERRLAAEEIARANSLLEQMAIAADELDLLFQTARQRFSASESR